MMNQASHSPIVGYGFGRGEVDDDGLRGPWPEQATKNLSVKHTVKVNLELCMKNRARLCKHSLKSLLHKRTKCCKSRCACPAYMHAHHFHVNNCEQTLANTSTRTRVQTLWA